jgi:hypothetical protein
MNTQLAGNEANLAAYYNFNQGVANGTNTGLTTLNGSTTPPYNGTLYNFALTGTTSNWVDGPALTTNTNIIPANTTYTWTVVPNANVNGESNQTTPQTSVSQTLTNLTNTVQTVVYTVTPVSPTAPCT